MITMAIDASTKSSGIAIFDNKKLVHYECIALSTTDTLARIKQMTIEIEKRYEQWKPTEVVLEDVLPEDVQNNLKVFKSLHYLQASIVLMMHSHKQKVELVVASSWRSHCGIQTGRGIKRDPLKAQAQLFVKKHYGLDVNDDIADAICLGHAHLNDPIPVVKTTTSALPRQSAF
jgi:Holliday junction resolvasome RuvABC endonuclease subunit